MHDIGQAIKSWGRTVTCCRSDWHGSCLFCCFQTSCVVSFFVLFYIFNFPILLPPNSPPPPLTVSEVISKRVVGRCGGGGSVSWGWRDLRGVKLDNLWTKKINSVSWQHTRVENTKTTPKQTKPSPVASAAPHPSLQGGELLGVTSMCRMPQRI